MNRLSATVKGACRANAWLAVFFIVAVLLPATASAQVTVTVQGPAGESVGSVRWTLEEDLTYKPVLNAPPDPGNPATLGVSFHRSYMPLVATGSASSSSFALDLPACGAGAWPCFDPGKNYFISVLPDSGYSIGGAPIPAGSTTVTVAVTPHRIPTAQITVFVFHDNNPINNAPDPPAEVGLEGFSIIVEDAGGRFGISAGLQSQDAFGNPLGTDYQTPGPTGCPAGYVLDEEDGSPTAGLCVKRGDGLLKTGPDGRLTIKNLVPGKYGIQAIPPVGTAWQQTSTIEGTKVIDAWVKANEPPYFMEFGPPGEHVYIGFVQPMTNPIAGSGGVTGQIVNMRLSRPPDYAFYNGPPFSHTIPWVGINDMAVGIGRGIFAQRAAADGSFSVSGLAPGNYQLVVWDEYMDIIFAFHNFTIPEGGGTIDLGDVPVFNWFTALDNYVFVDSNENGMWDPGEAPISDAVVNIRWRDGTIYQSFGTDVQGFAPFDQVFPFFAWQIAEIDYVRHKATGLTAIVDAGGPSNPADPWSFGGILNPQIQPDGLPYRVEQGPVLTQGFQGFLGQRSVIQWGKKAYGLADTDVPPYHSDETPFPGPGDVDQNGNGIFDPSNGGISGIVHYSTTRAEDNAQYGAAEVWEPGIPNVQVNLYQDALADGIRDDVDGGGFMPADVDNYPFGWRDGGAKGPEDIDRDGNGVFDLHDAIQVTWTDSWDDNLPTGCPGDPDDPFYMNARCYDGMRNWNQIRPAVFDGGYAFTSRWEFEGENRVEKLGLPEGSYIVEVIPPAGYQAVKEQDKNVDFGDEYAPAETMEFGIMAMAAVMENPLAFPACVGDMHTLPQELALFPGVALNTTELEDADPATDGIQRPLCDRKLVRLNDYQNVGANFFLFTEVPIAGHIYGFILDDTQNEFDPSAPTFGEKYAPPFLPVSIRDWTGKEINRVYSDRWGVYNGLVPSTSTANAPQPSGMSPGMYTVCLNDPRIPQPDGTYVPDPQWNPKYSLFCYTFQYMPGTTTYLDTPVVPIAAFAGPDSLPVDCQFPSGTPVISYATTAGSAGEANGNGPYAQLGAGGSATVYIFSLGTAFEVPNPAYDETDEASTKTIPRDYGFGDTPGTVTLGNMVLSTPSWSADVITAVVPYGAETGQLMVRKADGTPSITGVTFTVGRRGEPSPKMVPPGGSIQQVIDMANHDDLILVPPGQYEELVIMWKPVRLQGFGAPSVLISAVKSPAEKLDIWRHKVNDIILSGAVDLLPNQAFGGLGEIEPATLFNEEGPGILVLAKNANNVNQGAFGQINIGGGKRRPNSRIDGFTIAGADHGGGIVVNAYAHYLEISNNRVTGNQGVFGGGIRLGHPDLLAEDEASYENARNDNVRIHHNWISQNGGLNGPGGGISLCTGSDSYAVIGNWICGNFSGGDGGGIGHYGLSASGRIEGNTVIFNESFSQLLTVSGGGISIAGAAPLVGSSVSPGSGSVSIVGNLIQSNSASAGDGGGIRLARINGQDILDNLNQPPRWYQVELFNNIVTNNVAALAGGALSLQDAVRVTAVHETIAENDSLATAGEAFAANSPNQSTPQPAGIVSRTHSSGLLAALAQVGNNRLPASDPNRRFSSPLLANSIVWQNRSFYFTGDPDAEPPVYGLAPQPDAPVYNDMAVLPAGSGTLTCTSCILTGSASPFVRTFVNQSRDVTVTMPETTTAIAVPPAFDEGGNFIRPWFGPLSLIDPDGAFFRNYHVTAGTPGSYLSGNGGLFGNAGNVPAALLFDFDGDLRFLTTSPRSITPHIGADQVGVITPPSPLPQIRQ